MATVTEERWLGSDQWLTQGRKNKAGRMPATVPSDDPKKWAKERTGEKVGPNSKTGGIGSGATPMSLQKGDGLEIWAQDVRKAHDAKRYDGTSTMV